MTCPLTSTLIPYIYPFIYSSILPSIHLSVLSITSNTSIPFKFLPSFPSLPSLPSIPLFHLSLPSFPYSLLPFIYPCLHLYSSICETIFYPCTPLSAFLYSTELVNSLFIYSTIYSSIHLFNHPFIFSSIQPSIHL